MSVESTKDTAEFCLPEELRRLCTAGVPSWRVEVEIGGLSHQGLVRPNNEDHFLITRFGRSLCTVLTNLPHDPFDGGHEEKGVGLLVADGMGGMAAGEVASREAIEALAELVISTPDWMLKADEQSIDTAMRRMAGRFQQINEKLVHQGQNDPTLHGMGTTMTLAANLGLDLILCHIGDSRAYRWRNGNLQQLTRDMTVAQQMVEAGMITPAAAATDRLRHYLTHYLGAWGKGNADVQYQALEDGDQIMLCTDGLTEMVNDKAIADTLNATDPPQAVCQKLVDQALARGGHDNVTVALARYRILE